jgi:PilZ domain
MNWGGVAERRHDIRVDCKVTCILRLGDLHHVATVKNFSLGGALVHFHSSPPTLHNGDNCIISMDGGSLLKYSAD